MDLKRRFRFTVPVRKRNIHLEKFDINEEVDHVICAMSGKKIPLEDLNYWNVEEQEAYFSYIEASMKKNKLSK